MALDLITLLVTSGVAVGAGVAAGTTLARRAARQRTDEKRLAAEADARRVVAEAALEASQARRTAEVESKERLLKELQDLNASLNQRKAELTRRDATLSREAARVYIGANRRFPCAALSSSLTPAPGSPNPAAAGSTTPMARRWRGM